VWWLISLCWRINHQDTRGNFPFTKLVNGKLEIQTLDSQETETGVQSQREEEALQPEPPRWRRVTLSPLTLWMQTFDLKLAGEAPKAPNHASYAQVTCGHTKHKRAMFINLILYRSWISKRQHLLVQWGTLLVESGRVFHGHMEERLALTTPSQSSLVCCSIQTLKHD